MNQSEEIDQLATALAAAQGEFEGVPKTAENPFFKSKYADLPSVVLAASPILSKHGLAVSQLPDFDGEHDLLTTIIMHKSGQWLQATARLHLVKTDPQAQGSATTYMRRYAYSGALGIVTETDDDGNAGSQDQPSGRSRSAAPSTTRRSRPAPTANVDQGGEPSSSNGHVNGNGSAASESQLCYLGKLQKKNELSTAGLVAFCATAAGRPITALNELTATEASTAIDQLTKGPAEETYAAPTNEEPF